MKIKHVEELVGISSKNIRFYEEQGLLTPSRAENNYREYHEADIIRLKQIKFLRKLGVMCRWTTCLLKSLPEICCSRYRKPRSFTSAS